MGIYLIRTGTPIVGIGIPNTGTSPWDFVLFADLNEFTMGQKVRELVSGRLARGVHTAVWDVRDDKGGGVSSGVYISHLKTRAMVAAKRMLLLR